MERGRAGTSLETVFGEEAVVGSIVGVATGVALARTGDVDGGTAMSSSNRAVCCTGRVETRCATDDCGVAI